MKDAIAFVLGNFTLAFFVLGLLAAAIALWRGRTERGRAAIVEALFSIKEHNLRPEMPGPFSTPIS